MPKIDDFALVEFIGDVHSAVQAGAPGINVPIGQAKAAVQAAEIGRDAQLMEREAIVAWLQADAFILRDTAARQSTSRQWSLAERNWEIAAALTRTADRIKRGEHLASVDTCRMAETGTGSGRSPGGAVPREDEADAQPLTSE